MCSQCFPAGNKEYKKKGLQSTNEIICFPFFSRVGTLRKTFFFSLASVNLVWSKIDQNRALVRTSYSEVLFRTMLYSLLIAAMGQSVNTQIHLLCNLCIKTGGVFGWLGIV